MKPSTVNRVHVLGLYALLLVLAWNVMKSFGHHFNHLSAATWSLVQIMYIAIVAARITLLKTARNLTLPTSRLGKTLLTIAPLLITLGFALVLAAPFLAKVISPNTAMAIRQVDVSLMLIGIFAIELVRAQQVSTAPGAEEKAAPPPKVLPALAWIVVGIVIGVVVIFGGFILGMQH